MEFICFSGIYINLEYIMFDGIYQLPMLFHIYDCGKISRVRRSYCLIDNDSDGNGILMIL